MTASPRASDAATRDEKRARLADLLRRRAAAPRVFPVSFAQERLWFLDELAPGSPAYNIPAALRVRGALNLPAFEQALAEIARRHEVLRTLIDRVEDRPVQRVLPTPHVRVACVSLRALSNASREDEMSRLGTDDARRPFDLGRGPLLRVTVVELDEQEYVILVTLHHIVADGWSLGVLLTEMRALYGAYERGRVSPLPPLRLQYADYAMWQRQQAASGAFEGDLRYWRERLRDLASLDLPTDRPRPVVPSFRGSSCRLAIERSIVDSLKVLSRREGATLFMTLVAAFVVVLARYTDREDIAIGTPVANRTRPELEGLIGFLANTLALRVDASGNPSFAELLRRVRETAVGAYAHQELPFEKLVAELRLARDWSRHPLFDVMFVLQNTPMPALTWPGLDVSLEKVVDGSSNFDLTLTLTEIDGALEGGFEYPPELFEAARIRQLGAHLTAVLQGVSGDASASIWEVPLEERAADIVEPRGLEAEDVVPALIAQAARTPDAIAIEGDEGAPVTYAQLVAAIGGVAAALRARGVGAEVRVGVWGERSVEQVIAVWGVLAAGGAYVPLDGEAPAVRLAQVIADARLALVVATTRAAAAWLPVTVPVLVVEETAPAPEIALAAAVPAQLAYVLYTSGSTGRPKGVGVSRGALAAYTAAAADRYAIAPTDRCLQFAALTFDTSVEEIVPCLTRGGCLVLRTAEMLQSAATFLAECARRGVTVLNLPTAYWHLLVREEAGHGGAWPTAIRLVIIGGERAERRPWRAWQQWVGPRMPLLNTYGPTEATVVATVADVSAPDEVAAEVPIGVALPHACATVVDRAGGRVPLGAAGELCIGGASVARGYVGDPALTAVHFVPDPAGAEPGARRYRTGDRARVRADGQLEFLGRRDRQVKVRGQRVELGEIEAVLTRHAAVADAAAVVTGAGDEASIVAVVARRPGHTVTGAALRGWLREQVPAALVPARVGVVDALPRLTSGKVDRRRVATLGATLLPETETRYVAPRTEIEALLATIWSDVLGVERVGVTETFFELGGHSLLATQIVARLRRLCGVELTLRQFFAAPTVAALAAAVASAPLVDGAPELVPRTDGTAPLSFAQERIWFLDQLLPDQPFHNIPAAVRVHGPLDIDRLTESVSAIVERHAVLRTVFGVAGGVPYQVATAARPVVVPAIDLRSLAPDARNAEVRRLAHAEADRPFSLSRGPVLRVRVILVDADEHVVLLTVHHIAADGWSIGVLLRELGALYLASLAGVPADLPGLPVQYADYARWQREWIAGDALQRERQHWHDRLGGAPPLVLPTDRPRPAIQGFRAARYPVAIDSDVCARLNALSRRESATLFMTLAATFGVLLGRYTGQEDFCIGTAIAGRTRVELEPLIGCFINTLVLRMDLSGAPSFVELLQRVRGRTIDAYTHQHMPFEHLVAELRPKRDLSRNPLVQVLLVLQNAPVESLAVSDLDLVDVEIGEGTSTFDLVLSLGEADGRLHGVMAYAPELFERESIARMIDDFQTLVARVVDDPAAKIGDLAPRRAGDRKPLAGVPGGVPAAVEEPATAGHVPRRAPRTADEARLAHIVASALKIEDVETTDDFFDRGGHSMLAIQVLSRIADEFGVQIPLRAFFETPTVAGLSAHISRLAGDVAWSVDV